jgi:FMN phosphatase YigB (HAD superfamily)
MTIIASFDVFDTVLTRAVGSPSAVFLLLGRRLKALSLIECTAEAFARARGAAELRAYKNVGVANTTLVHIYAELSTSLWLEKARCDQIMKMECELEAELLRLVPDGQRLIREARAKGQRVAFLSDMYLPGDFISAQLARQGVLEPGDPCYVSCHHLKLKHTGDLFRQLLKDEKVAAESVLHHGNHPDYDVRAAREAGLQVRPFYEGNINRYERILESYSLTTDGLTSVMAGASRLARLNLRGANKREQALRDVAAGVAAPALVGFILWVLQKAKQAGLRRLYFISRDGQILLEIARRLAVKLNVNCELRYLYGSRQAWNLSGIRSNCEIDRSWMWDNTDFLSVESLLSRICIRPDELRESLIAYGFEERSWSRNLDQTERLHLTKLVQQDEIQTLIFQRATENRAVFLKYLEQEGVLDAGDWALVDLGWGGSLQNSLASVSAELRDTPPAGFYFGLEGRPEHERFGARETYFYDVRRGTGFLKGAGYRWVPLLEMFCAADHGTVVALVERATSVEALLKEERNEMAIQWGLPVVQRTVCSFAEHLFLDSGLIDVKADMRGAIEELLEAFWLTPTRDEALAWGEFPWEDGFGAHSYHRKLGESYGWRDVIRVLHVGRLEVLRRLPCWSSGSLAVTPRYIQKALRAALRFANLRDHLIEACWRGISAHESRGSRVVSRILRVVVFLVRPGLVRRLGNQIGYGGFKRSA